MCEPELETLRKILGNEKLFGDLDKCREGLISTWLGDAMWRFMPDSDRYEPVSEEVHYEMEAEAGRLAVEAIRILRICLHPVRTNHRQG